MIPKNIDPRHGYASNTTGVLEYLDGRGISRQMQADLGIQYLAYAEAISPRWGFGKQATSPDGVIAFPVSEEVAIARNFYPTRQSQTQHLACINKAREAGGHEPAKKVPKYILPVGDRGKGILYDPYSLLHPDTEQTILFATEDIFGVIKAAERGCRVISTVGIWLVSNEELQSNQMPAIANQFDRYLSDGDGLENRGVCGGIIRSGIVLGCKIGCFPQTDKTKVGLDEWLDANPQAGFNDLRQLAEDNTADTLSWLETTYLNLNTTLEGRGYNTTEAAKIARGIRQSVRAELFKHFSLEELQANGFYSRVLKPAGMTLRALRSQATESRAESKKSTADVVTILIEIGTGTELFHDTEQVAFADVLVDGVRQTHKLRSSSFRSWVFRQLYEKTGGSARGDAYLSALNTLESIALFDGVERRVWLRTAEHGGKVYLDLANDQWQAVEIDALGWRIVDRPPVRFLRPSTLGELPVPTTGGNLENLRELVNIEDREWTLLITFLLFAYTQGPTYPVLMLMAARGSGKTAITGFLKSLIDPGKAGLINLHPDAHRLAVSATKRWLMAYDNVSRISSEQSDMLCRVSTGFGFSTRTLFTTEDETVFEVARPQIITAIDAIVTRDDLADRLLLVQLPRINQKDRLTKEALNAKLTKLRPGILGALLDVLSQTLAALPRTNPGELPRMADYGRFAIAAEGALGLETGSFWQAFNCSRETARAVVLEASPLAEAITVLVRQRGEWSGTAPQLLKTLEDYADEQIIRSKFWPRTTNALGRQLKRLAPDLEASGVEVTISRSKSSRIINVARRTVLGSGENLSFCHPDDDKSLESI